MADWSLVLEAAGIRHHQVHGPYGWELWVGTEDVTRARQALDGYDAETRRPERPFERPLVEPYGSSWIGLGVAVALTVFFVVTGPVGGTNPWSQLGSSAAERILHGELWRATTALTLHADPAHLLGNVIACIVFVTFLGNRLGPGVALWVTLLAGALGNLLTAIVTRDHHIAVGASTATFGALGALIGMRATSIRRIGSNPSVWMVLAAGGALLGMLGTSPGADVLAHFFGLACGAVLGAALSLARAPLRSQWGQGALTFAAAGAIALCWALAFSRGSPI